MTRVISLLHLTVDEFKDVVALHIDVLNAALGRHCRQSGMRLHLCWGQLRRTASL